MMEKKKNKKKITLNNIGLVLLVLLLAGCFYTWRARTAAEAQLSAISNNLTKAQTQMAALIDPADDLESELAAVKAQLAAAQDGFPNTLERNEVVDYLLDMAGNYDIDILPLQSYGWADLAIGQPYRVLKIAITARGSLENVENFMNGLHAGRYSTLVISGCQVSRSDVLSPGFPGDDMQVTVNMEIRIYTVPSSAGEGVLS